MELCWCPIKPIEIRNVTLYGRDSHYFPRERNEGGEKFFPIRNFEIFIKRQQKELK